MLAKEDCWGETGDVFIPIASHVADRGYWRAAGGLLALLLIAGESLHPVSPAVIYALLSNVHKQADPSNPMDVSLGFIQQLQSCKASVLLPWMIIPPGQDWKNLPEGHQVLLRNLLSGLNLHVSSQHPLTLHCESDCHPSSAASDTISAGPCGMDQGHCYLCIVGKWLLLFHCAIPGDAKGLQGVHLKG